MTVKKVKQWKYKPAVHKREDHVYVTLNESIAEYGKARAEREAHERKWGWVGETFQWLIYLAFFGFLVTSCVQGDFKQSEPRDCRFMYRGACDG